MGEWWLPPFQLTPDGLMPGIAEVIEALDAELNPSPSGAGSRRRIQTPKRRRERSQCRPSSGCAQDTRPPFASPARLLAHGEVPDAAGARGSGDPERRGAALLAGGTSLWRVCFRVGPHGMDPQGRAVAFRERARSAVPAHRGRTGHSRTRPCWVRCAPRPASSGTPSSERNALISPEALPAAASVLRDASVRASRAPQDEEPPNRRSTARGLSEGVPGRVRRTSAPRPS
jgi:hypothetical protein